MDLDEMLGIDPNDELDKRAADLLGAAHSLRQQLVHQREHRGLNQADVARVMGISQSAVSRIEAGDRDPRLSTLLRYAMAVGAHLEFTVRDANDVESNVRHALAVDPTWSSQLAYGVSGIAFLGFEHAHDDRQLVKDWCSVTRAPGQVFSFPWDRSDDRLRS